MDGSDPVLYQGPRRVFGVEMSNSFKVRVVLEVVVDGDGIDAHLERTCASSVDRESRIERERVAHEVVKRGLRDVTECVHLSGDKSRDSQPWVLVLDVLESEVIDEDDQ